MVLAGMDVCRINFSHGTTKQHTEIVENIKAINRELGLNITILGDLQGPKLRIGAVQEGTELEDGTELIVTTEKCIGTASKIFVSYPALPVDVSLGDNILIDDGNITMVVTKKIDESNLKAKVIPRWANIL